MKLNYADIKPAGIPIACGDDHIKRHEIIKTAFNRARVHYQRERYNTVVYVGHRLWDYHASQKLNIKFIGVGNEFLKSELNIPRIDNYISDDLINYLHRLKII